MSKLSDGRTRRRERFFRKRKSNLTLLPSANNVRSQQCFTKHPKDSPRGSKTVNKFTGANVKQIHMRETYFVILTKVYQLLHWCPTKKYLKSRHLLTSPMHFLLAVDLLTGWLKSFTPLRRASYDRARYIIFTSMRRRRCQYYTIQVHGKYPYSTSLKQLFLLLRLLLFQSSQLFE